jgi:hypothetical protein
MRIDQNPLFRKTIISWYDSEAMCIGLIIFMIIVFFFGVIGISVALESEEYQEHVWIAALLVVMSAGVIFSTTIRLIKRHSRRISK